ncbi:MAG: hypothetical protein ABSB41_12560 [Anaerolineales bacterium]|jgi:hypothetical protein
MKNKLLVTIAILVITGSVLACSSGISPADIQAAIVQTETAWTPVPSQTAYPTYTPYVVTRVVIQTPAPNLNNPSCKPITDMDYSDNTKIAVELQYYVSNLPDVHQVSYTIPEKLYTNTVSELIFVQYVGTDGKPYAKRYIVYIKEFGWENAVFSIDGQCWIDPPH